MLTEEYRQRETIRRLLEERAQDREEITQLRVRRSEDREAIDSWKKLYDDDMLEVGRLNALAMNEKLEQIQNLRRDNGGWIERFRRSETELLASEKRAKDLEQELVDSKQKAANLQVQLDVMGQRWQRYQDENHVLYRERANKQRQLLLSQERELDLVREVDRLRKTLLENVPESLGATSIADLGLEAIRETIRLALANAQALQDTCKHPDATITVAWTQCAEAMISLIRLERELLPSTSVKGAP